MSSVTVKRRRQRDPMSAEAVAMVAERFRILGEPFRIRILQALEAGEKNVSELVAALGSTQPNVSKHLRILQESGIVGRRQQGTLVFYEISDPSVFDLCDVVCSSVREMLTSRARVGDELARGVRG